MIDVGYIVFQMNKKKKTNMKQINGNVLELDLSDPQVAAHFANPYNYTKEIIEQFDHDIYKGIVTEKDHVVLDCGANVGLFTLHILPYAKKIICVEPTPEHMAIQKKLIPQGLHGKISPQEIEDARKRLSPKDFKELYVDGSRPEVIHEESAVNSYTGKTNFHKCGINTTMNSLHHQNREAAFQVNCYTLADLLDKYNLDRVDLCKIDIEGGEDIAITTDLLKACNGRIKKVFIELHPGNTESQDKFTKIFEDAGFTVRRNHNDALICTIK